MGAPVAAFYSEIRPQGSVTHNVIFSQEGDLVLNGFFQKNRLWDTNPQGEALGAPVASFYSEIRPQGSVTHSVIFSQEGDLVLSGFFQKNRL